MIATWIGFDTRLFNFIFSYVFEVKFVLVLIISCVLDNHVRLFDVRNIRRCRHGLLLGVVGRHH